MPNPALPATLANAISASPGLDAIELRSLIKFLSPSHAAAFKAHIDGADSETVSAIANVMDALIAEIVLTSNQASVTFADIPQTFRHLQLFSHVQSTAGIANDLSGQVNGDASAFYGRVYLAIGGGNIFTASFTQNGLAIGVVNGMNAGTVFADSQCVIHAYTSAHAKISYSTGIYFNLGTQGEECILNASRWYGASPITSLTILAGTGSLVAGSKFQLYGIR